MADFLRVLAFFDRSKKNIFEKKISMVIRIPAEWENHSCCWMAWAIHREWGKTANKVKRELSEVIHTIARYEPVRVLVARGRGFNEARKEFSSCATITVVAAPVDDIWMRDIAPTFALRTRGAQQEVIAIDWNFNRWGAPPERPLRPGDRLAKTAEPIFGVPRVRASFVGEGGAIISDGDGMLITTRSCLLNPNRNPPQLRADTQRLIDRDLHRLGGKRIIWLEGDPCEPITSGHVDGYALFAPGGIVLVDACDDAEVEPPMWRAHDIALLRKAENIGGRRFRVRPVLAPRPRHYRGDPETFAASYLNAYVANGAVIAARFGDQRRDAAARRALAAAFPGREVVMLRIDNIANGGGGIHCLTQPQPALPNATSLT